MKKNKKKSTGAAGLRFRAKKLFRVRDVSTGSISTEVVVRRLFMDITERKLLEEELRRSEIKFATAFQATPSALVISSLADGKYKEVNNAFEQLMGYQRDEVIGRSALELKIWQNQEDRDRILRMLAEGTKVRDQEIGFRGKSGTILVALYSAETIELGTEQCLLSLFSDITARKQAEGEIRRLNSDLNARAADLENANHELEAFNYTVAHDLRQPLNVINGYCQAIMTLYGDRLVGQCKDYLQSAYDGTLRMNRLIEALLDFSRMGHVEPHREIIDLSEQAREVVLTLKQSAPERRVDFRIADKISICGDANLLRVVLENLLGNAWKYTGFRDEAVIELGALEIDGKPVCFVRDNGAGFDMAVADKLFAPFLRLPGSEEYRGFGIGLATVERIIRRHGGKVWAEGEPGRGATFFFTL